MDALHFGRNALIARSDMASREAAAVPAGAARNAGLIDAIEALRLAVLATVAVDEDVEADPPVWARVELFGHKVVYGLVGDVVRAGRRWVEVECPAYTRGDVEHAAKTKLYHPNAVYAIEEIGEAEVMKETTYRPPFF